MRSSWSSSDQPLRNLPTGSGVPPGRHAEMILRTDTRHIPLRDGCVQCVVTSPPYWGLRDWAVEGQIGLESTLDEYVATMVAVFREVWRVLRDDGTVWLNLGDSYVHGIPGGGSVFVNGRNDGRKSYESDKPRGRQKISTLALGLKMQRPLRHPLARSIRSTGGRLVSAL
jgi:hypothetical protein